MHSEEGEEEKVKWKDNIRRFGPKSYILLGLWFVIMAAIGTHIKIDIFDGIMAIVCFAKAAYAYRLKKEKS